MIKVMRSIAIKRKIRLIMFNKWVLLIFNIEVPEQINRKTLMALSKPIISRIIKKES